MGCLSPAFFTSQAFQHSRPQSGPLISFSGLKQLSGRDSRRWMASASPFLLNCFPRGFPQLPSLTNIPTKPILLLRFFRDTRFGQRMTIERDERSMIAMVVL